MLRPLDEVEPRGDPPHLHWLGLTDGWYWIEGGGHELPRRARVDDPRPCVDHQVGRLWQDVAVLAPAVLEPVPEDLLPFLASEPESWVANWLGQVRPANQDGDRNAPDPPAVEAALWHGEHLLDLHSPVNRPRVRLWRTIRDDGDRITVDRRHHDDGRTAVTAGPVARFTVPTTEYLDAVHTFDRELIAAMAERVGELERRGGLPGVGIDLARLRREHDDQAHWLQRHLSRSPATDWAVIRAGAAELLGHAPPAGASGDAAG